MTLNLDNFDTSKLKAFPNKDKICLIIVHHTAGSGQTVEQINQAHRRLGWAGIGYHYYIRTDGHVYVGRPSWAIGSHCKGNNSCSIGVAFEGDFRKTKPTEEQIKSAKELVKQIVSRYPTIKRVLNHKDLYPTLCPVVNLKEMITGNKEGWL